MLTELEIKRGIAKLTYKRALVLYFKCRGFEHDQIIRPLSGDRREVTREAVQKHVTAIYNIFFPKELSREEKNDKLLDEICPVFRQYVENESDLERWHEIRGDLLDELKLHQEPKPDPIKEVEPVRIRPIDRRIGQGGGTIIGEESPPPPPPPSPPPFPRWASVLIALVVIVISAVWLFNRCVPRPLSPKRVLETLHVRETRLAAIQSNDPADMQAPFITPTKTTIDPTPTRTITPSITITPTSTITPTLTDTRTPTPLPQFTICVVDDESGGFSREEIILYLQREFAGATVLGFHQYNDTFFNTRCEVVVADYTVNFQVVGPDATLRYTTSYPEAVVIGYYMCCGDDQKMLDYGAAQIVQKSNLPELVQAIILNYLQFLP